MGFVKKIFSINVRTLDLQMNQTNQTSKYSALCNIAVVPLFRRTDVSTIRYNGLSNHWYSPIVRHHYTVSIYRQYRTVVSTVYCACDWIPGRT